MNNIIKLIKNWLLHCAVIWVALNISLVIAILKNNENSQAAWGRFLRHNLSSEMPLVFLLLLLTEISYQYLFRRFRLVWFIVVSLLLGLSGVLILGVMARVTRWPEYLLDLMAPVLMFAAYNLLYSLIRDYFYQKQHKKELQLQQSQSELNALKAQLNPHFLFNSLNYLYGTALKEQATQTADGIDKLSGMMRYTITGMHENFVPLTDELNFTENYLELQRARLPVKNNIRINTAINVPACNLQIAPLLLLPFIENAFKYGISMDEPCFVDLAINLVNNRLTLMVANSIIKHPAEVKGSNTGIANTAKRLELIYPDNYELTNSNKGDTYQVSLIINLKTQS